MGYAITDRRLKHLSQRPADATHEEIRQLAMRLLASRDAIRKPEPDDEEPPAPRFDENTLAVIGPGPGATTTISAD